MKRLTCPHCGFSKELPAERIPADLTRVTCPKCRKQFSLDPVPPLQAVRDDGRQPESSASRENPTTTAQPEKAEPAAAEPKKPAAPPPEALVEIRCPHCGNCRELPAAKVPSRKVKVACNECRQTFTLDGDRLLAQLSAQVSPRQPAARSASSVPPVAPAAGSCRLTRIGDLFEASWVVFKRRIMTLLGINLSGLALLVVGYMLFGWGVSGLQGAFGDSLLLLVPVVLIGVLMSFVVFAVLGAAMTYALVDEDLGVRQSVAYGLQNFTGFLWVVSLVGFIVGGGYLLLLLPGLLFMTWFVFAQFIFAGEDVRGMEALLKSRAYVRGQELPVCGRILLIGLFGSAITAIPVVGPLLGLLVAPFTLIFYHEVYLDLRRVRGSISYSVTRSEKAKWLAAGGSGYLVAVLLVAVLFGSLFMQGLALFTGTSSPQTQPAWQNRSQGESGQESSLKTAQEPRKAGLYLANDSLAPGESFTVRFEVPAGVSSGALLALVPGDRAAQSGYSVLTVALSYHYLDGTMRGEYQFIAPETPGSYSLCLYQSDSADQKLAFVDFTVENMITVQGPGALPLLDAPAVSYPSPVQSPIQSPIQRPDVPRVSEGQSPSSISIPTKGESRQQAMIFIGSFNYQGEIRLNGDELMALSGEAGVSDSYSAGIWLEAGSNSLELSYNALPGSQPHQLDVRIYEQDWQQGGEVNYGVWSYDDAQGYVTINIYVE